MGAKIRSGGRFFINGKDGGVANGWKVETFDAGSAGVLGSDDKAAYTDYTLGTEQTNPIILDSRGEAEVWWNGAYLIKIYDENDVLIYSLDYFGSGEDASADSAVKPVNGSFEIDTNGDGIPDNWTLTPGANGTITISTADSASGPSSLLFTGTDATGGGTAVSDKFNVTKLDEIAVHYSYFSSAVDTLNKIDITWYNAADAVISTTPLLSEGAANPTSWVNDAQLATVPSTAIKAAITLTGVDGAGTTTAGTTYFDDISYVRRVTSIAEDIESSISGTTVDFTAPAGVKKIVMFFKDVRVDTINNQLQIKLDDDATFLTFTSVLSGVTNVTFDIQMKVTIELVDAAAYVWNVTSVFGGDVPDGVVCEYQTTGGTLATIRVDAQGATAYTQGTITTRYYF